MSDHITNELTLIPASKQVYDALLDYILSEGLTYVEQSLESDLAVSQSSPDDLMYHIVIYFDQCNDIHHWCERFQSMFTDAQLQIKVKKLQASIWKKAWDESLHDVASHRFWIHQMGLSEDPRFVGLEKITIDALNAFGTGQHATTLASLKIVEELPLSDSFLDVGTGTGILAIAAKKLGFKHIVATDIDHDAIESAKVNLVLNGCEDIKLIQGSFPEENDKFDIVVSNILVPEVLRLLPELMQRLSASEKARLILSGFHEANEDMVIDAVKAYDFDLVKRSSERSWLALSFQKST